MAKTVTVFEVQYATGRVKMYGRSSEPEMVTEKFATRQDAAAVATIALSARVYPIKMTYAIARRNGWAQS